MGEALVDLVIALDGSIRPYLGGGPYNTARTLGRLEVPVAFLGRVSDDSFGRQILARLAIDGVSTTLVVPTTDPTTLAVATLDERGAATYRFYFEGTSVPGMTPEMAATQLPDAIDALHVGTLALVLEPFADAVESVLRDLDEDTLVFVDPNIRPSVIADRRAYLTRLARVLAHADVVKVSDDDLAWISPGVAPEEAARAMLNNGPNNGPDNGPNNGPGDGPSVVLLTMGERGVLVVTPAAADVVEAPAVEVVDTIGAGDSFAGGVLAWWHDHGRPDLTERSVAIAATAFGCLVAAATVATAGANPPRRSELAPS